MGLLDTAISNYGPKVIGSQNDLNKIAVDPKSVDDAIRSLSGSRGWDAAEYGITQAQAEAQLRAADTPEARERVMAALRQRAIRRASLDNTTGRIAAAFARQPGWHQLGTVFSTEFDTVTLKGMPEHNFKMEKLPLFIKHPKTGEMVEDPDNFHIWRTDTWERLTTQPVGSKFEIITQEDSWEMMDAVVGEYGARYESAGVIYKGRQSWAQIHMPKYAFTIGKNSHVEPYILYFKRNDGTGRDLIFPTNTRAECANTTRIAVGKRGDKGIGLRHSGSIKAKVQDAREALGLSIKGFDEFKEEAITMNRTTLTDAEFQTYCSDVLDYACEVTKADMDKGVDVLARAVAKTQAEYELAQKRIARQITRRENILEEILQIHESKTCDGIRGSVYGGFNAITESAEWGLLGGRQKGDELKKASKRFESTIYGEQDDVKQVALQRGLQFAN